MAGATARRAAGGSRRVAVVGAGVVGLATAYHLCGLGAKVTVVERATVGSGASWGNSGWIAPSFSEPLPGPGMVSTALKALFRPNGSFYIAPTHLPRLAPWLWSFWRSSTAGKQRAGLNAIAGLSQSTRAMYETLAGDGVCFQMQHEGVVHAFLDRRNAEAAQQRLLPLSRYGIAVPDKVLSGPQLREVEPALGDAVAAGFVVPDEGTVYPPSLLAGLRDRLCELGAVILEHHPVIDFVVDAERVTAVVTAKKLVEADGVVLAAGVWSRQLAARLKVKLPLEAGKGYSFTATPERMPKHSIHLYEAKVAASPFQNGLRLAGTMELSGLDQNLNRRRLNAVARAARPYFSVWKDRSLKEEWMGMRPMTADGLPVIGRARPWRNLYIATGHGMMGVMLAPATGQAVAELVLLYRGEERLAPFSPDRFTTRPVQSRGEEP